MASHSSVSHRFASFVECSLCLVQFHGNRSRWHKKRLLVVLMIWAVQILLSTCTQHPHCKPHQLLKNYPEHVEEQAGAPGVSGMSVQGQRRDTCPKPCCVIWRVMPTHRILCWMLDSPAGNAISKVAKYLGVGASLKEVGHWDHASKIMASPWSLVFSLLPDCHEVSRF